MQTVLLVLVVALQVGILAIITSAISVLHDLAEGLSDLTAAQRESTYLRTQNTDLHERLLAVHDAGAQARLAAQRSPKTLDGGSPIGPGSWREAKEFPPTRRRAPQEVILPDSPLEPES